MISVSIPPNRAAGEIDSPPDAINRTRLLVLDDHAAVRAGLRDLLMDQPDFHVVAVVATAEDALSVAEREPIDIAVVDYQLGGRNGLWVSRQLKRLPRPPAVIIYSAYADGLLAAAAVVAQADGILSKGGLGSELCETIRRVSSGRGPLPTVPDWLAETLRHRLDHEEQAVFGMLLAGIEPGEIAQTLALSRAGLESLQGRMLRHLEVLDLEPRDRRTAARG